MTGRDKRKRTRNLHSAPSGSGSSKRPRHPRHRPTARAFSSEDDQTLQIEGLARKNWLPRDEASSSDHVLGADEAMSLISDIYRNYICSVTPEKALSALVCYKYFEEMLWPTYRKLAGTNTVAKNSASLANVINSIFATTVHAALHHPESSEVFVNVFGNDPGAFTALCHAPFQDDEASSSNQERCWRVYFLTQMYRRFDHSCVREALGPFVSISSWVHLSDGTRQEQLQHFPSLRKSVQRAVRRARKRKTEKPPVQEEGLHRLIQKLEEDVATLLKCPCDGVFRRASALVALFSELISQQKIRTIVHPLLADRATLLLVHGATYALLDIHPSASTTGFWAWVGEVDLFADYFNFPYDSASGEALSRDTVRSEQSNVLLTLQSAVHSLSRRGQLPSGHPLSFVPLAPQIALRGPNALRPSFASSEERVLHEILKSFKLDDSLQIGHAASAGENDSNTTKCNFAKSLSVGALTYLCERGTDVLESFRRSTPLLHDGDIYPSQRKSNCYSNVRLPCLNTSFLNMQDYLLRNYRLYRAEAASMIRIGLEGAIHQLKPTWNGKKIEFLGSSDAALPVKNVGTPEIGMHESTLLTSRGVKLEVKANLSQCSDEARRTWQEPLAHEMLFLIRLQVPDGKGGARNKEQVSSMLSESNVCGFRVEARMASGKEAGRGRAVNERSFIGFVDSLTHDSSSPALHHPDMKILQHSQVLFRCSLPQSFVYSYLSPLREALLDENSCLPSWFEHILIGRSLGQEVETEIIPDEEDQLDFFDTFLSQEHLKSAFLDGEVRFLENEIGPAAERSLYNLRFSKLNGSLQVEAEAYSRRDASVSRWFRDEGSTNQTMNTLEYNPAQVDAIRTAMSSGLTLLVGPPGTGKTSCVVQVTTNLFYSTANERVLIITRTNQALDNVVSRILTRSVDPLRVVKMGHESVSTLDEALSPSGRVDALLARRIHLLSKVAHLAACVRDEASVVPTKDWNCELADQFYQNVVRTQWQRFTENTEQSWAQFPFKDFFPEEAHGEHGSGAKDVSQDPLVWYSRIASLFEEVDDLRFLEVIRRDWQRRSYVLCAHSKVVAMTQHYAASHRNELISEAFSYDTLIVEEASALVEAELFPSFVLQKQASFSHGNRLKRVILVGDPSQTPHVGCEKLRNAGNLRQSMFHRLIRLGNEKVTLGQQGRCRTSIADLFRWKYPGLEDMKRVSQDPSFLKANPGLAFTAQFVDAGDVTSEKQLTSTSSQNLVEAEFIAFVYIYMRLLGYSSHSIAVLTAYHDQERLLKETLTLRLSQFPEVRGICSVSTVENFQAQEADFVLLSLVRTTRCSQDTGIDTVSAAVSRARLGVYMFGHCPLFESFSSFKPVFKKLPSSRQLTLVANETFTDFDRSEEEAVHSDTPLREVHSAADMAVIVSHLYSVLKTR